MSIDSGGRRYLAWLGTESGYQPLRADLGTVSGYTEVSRHRRREVVQITLGTGLEAYNQLRAALADRGLDFMTVEEIPFDIELVGEGSVTGMFYLCSSLTTVPDLDTSNVTDMSQMFYLCSSLTTVPDLDTSNVTNMSLMFYNCSSLTHMPDMDTSSVTDMSQMFYLCSSLTTVPDLDTSNVTNMRGMFGGCESLTYVPDLDTSNVMNMTQMFALCSSLTDGNVRLIGRNPSVITTNMIVESGLTREPWYNPDGTPDDEPTGPEVVQITLGTGNEARDQFRSALSDRMLNYRRITEVPFEIELVGSGSAQNIFSACAALTTAPAMDTRNVTDMSAMFSNCLSLTTVPDLDTSNVTNMNLMFSGCSALTDGNVRLIGKHPDVSIYGMITNSGLTREPFYDADGNPI